jgi:hypothetical protein
MNKFALATSSKWSSNWRLLRASNNLLGMTKPVLPEVAFGRMSKTSNEAS